MPRVPDYSNFQTQVSGLPNAQFQAPSGPTAGGIAADQASQFGQAATKSGTDFGRIALDVADQANQVRVNDAVNQARIAAQDLAYNQQTGYLTKKGANAFLDEQGKPLEQPLTQSYGEKLQSTLSEITANLGNDQQRRLFQMHAGDMTSQFHGQVEAHMLQQFGTYRVNTLESTYKLEGQNAALNYNNPDAVSASIGRAKAAIREKAEFLGLVGTPFTEAVLAGTSAIHEGVIMAALQNNNPAYAATYMKQARDKGEMAPNDILKVQGHITEADALKQAQSAVSQQTVAAMPNLAPNSFDRMTQITAMSESGGRETNPNGTTVTSPKGAQGIMQVMPSTNKDPGFGVRPAQDDSPGERARVGRDYLKVMLTKYGDPAKAWAAYNAGPGALDKAVTASLQGRGQNDWLSYMPQETQAYVTKNLKALGGSGPVAPRATELEFVNGALARLGPDASPQAVKHTRDAAVQQFNVINKSLTERGDNALADAQRFVIDNRLTTLAQLPPQLKDALTQYAPGKMDDLAKFAAAQGNVPTDWGTYTNLRALAATNIAAFAGTDLRQQYHLLAPAQREQLLDLQMKAKDPSTQPEVVTLSQQLTIAHQKLQLHPSDAEKKGKFDDSVTQALAADTREKGRSLTFEERDKVIKRMMLTTSGSSWFSSDKRVYEVSGTPDEGGRKPKIGDDDRKLITAALTSEGFAPTEQNITARFKQRYGIK